ncbi:MAG: prolipoprotein diacylglyceryl transferase [Alphaproteobacteria bacterium]|nr:prolipoprotein diacylglyceryl transferase [Alphaproteobacteria bacterium]
MDFNIFNLDPIAFQIGPLVVRWYALAYLAGFLLGWKYCLKQVPAHEGIRPNTDDIDDFLTWAVIGVILGGRLGYVMFYQPEYYIEEPGEILKVWKGGMSFHGGVLGVMLAMLFFAQKRSFNVFKLSDVICSAAPIGLFFGRIANFINGELYGRVTAMPWGVEFPNAIGPRHPSQIYEALLEGVVLFLILRIFARNPNTPTGVVTGLFLLGYGVFRALVELVREPDVQLGLLGGFISMGQILCVPMIVAGAVIVYLAKQKKLEKTMADA